MMKRAGSWVMKYLSLCRKLTVMSICKWGSRRLRLPYLRSRTYSKIRMKVITSRN